jgi:hypothetical protein
MKIPAIQKLVNTKTIEECKQAENALIEGESLPFEVEGDDEGEQLTHLIAAAHILEDMKKNNCDYRTALRNYTQRVRNSIS